MSNIFYKHWLKRDGGLYKDLAFYNHEDRIKMLDDLISYSKESTREIKTNPELAKYKSLIKCNERAIKLYCRLKKFCNKYKTEKAIGLNQTTKEENK